MLNSRDLSWRDQPCQNQKVSARFVASELASLKSLSGHSQPIGGLSVVGHLSDLATYGQVAGLVQRYPVRVDLSGVSEGTPGRRDFDTLLEARRFKKRSGAPFPNGRFGDLST